MASNVGIWIDHRKTVVVTLADGKEKIETIPSGVEGHVRLPGGPRWGTQHTGSRGGVERRHTHHLQEYYQRVIGAIRHADHIFICGPGEAKLEFEKELCRSKELAGKVAGTAGVDKMTDGQIAAKVRSVFACE